MHNFDSKFQSLIYAVVTNKELSEDERSKIIAEFFDEFKQNYPNLEHAATKHELNETELRLIKEIESIRQETQTIRGEIKELTKEIESVRQETQIIRGELSETELRLTKEIESVRQETQIIRGEIKELDLKLTKEIEKSKTETIKWVSGMLFMQVIAIGGLFLTAFKLFGQ